jgi:large subunit ribosomal protein L25
MDTIELAAVKRDSSVKAKDLRRMNLIPAEFYGAGVENCSFQMDYQMFRKAYMVAGENTVIDLNVEGDASRKVLVHDVQFDPVSDKIRHVDFINVRMDKAVTTNIPLEFVGVSIAVKDDGGVLNTNLTEIEVTCLPGDLIHSIEVDISSLVDFHTSIHVSDLKLSDKITVLTDLGTTVATVAAPREEEVETAAPESATGEPLEGEEGAEASAEEGGE